MTLKADILLSIIQFSMTHSFCNRIRHLHNNIINQSFENDSIKFPNKFKPKWKRGAFYLSKRVMAWRQT